jgi:hypothetical protein
MVTHVNTMVLVNNKYVWLILHGWCVYCNGLLKIIWIILTCLNLFYKNVKTQKLHDFLV